MENKDIQNLLEKVNLLFSVLLKDGIENTTKIERELLKEQVQKLHAAIDTVSNANLNEIASNHNKDAEQSKKEFVRKEAEEEIKVDIDEPAPSEEIRKEPFIAFVDESNDASEDEHQEMNNEPETFEEEEAIDVQTAFPDKEFSTNEPKRKIKEIIDLNKSFILKAELFNGDIEAYNSFIEEMDTIPNEKASFEYLHNLAKQLDWDCESKVYELIVRVVEKRFIPII